VSAGIKVPLVEAERVADAIVRALAPGCERIEIAGSIRRRKAMVGDVELVCIPRFVEGPRVDLFQPPPMVSVLDDRLAVLEQAGRLVAHPTSPANGDRYKKRVATRSGMQVDLFIVRPPAEWGPIFAIRTGPADYSAAAVTALRARGMRCEDGAVWRGSERIPCPEEADFFAAVGWELVPPERRGT
jgi:DNA polymerase/3'-5' exonuclease PolX